MKVKEGLQVCDHIHQVYYRVTNHIWMMKLMSNLVEVHVGYMVETSSWLVGTFMRYIVHDVGTSWWAIVDEYLIHDCYILGTWLQALFCSIVDTWFMDDVAYLYYQKHILILVMIMSCCVILGWCTSLRVVLVIDLGE